MHTQLPEGPSLRRDSSDGTGAAGDDMGSLHDDSQGPGYTAQIVPSTGPFAQAAPPLGCLPEDSRSGAQHSREAVELGRSVVEPLPGAFENLVRESFNEPPMR